ncbi:type I restriction enzyme, S subunit [Litoreibacter ascidiaceicola]|uniref:Type I restriction enzyme, S subunit n=1 Tax=Litoreibacter ascidiaceicola TaxID=1486859 RepID=A0A1M4X222_9RHOB|nr:restriction endonuclease subunit S [Litoreibacter ascidiaceicola]SHE87393.1 type I restriction enzyme, S subunit [Litoreibacter ascidiaceicola]
MSERSTVSLGEVVDILTGNPFKSAEYEDGEANPKLLRGDNIAQGSLRWENVKRWPKSKSEGLDRYELKAGDVVLAMDRPWIEAGLKYACLSEHDLPAFLVQRVARMRGTERLRTDFLRYLIGSRAFTAHVLGVQTGTAVPHISAGQIKSYEFDLPSLEDQESIAAYLGSLDDKIELNRRMNETLEEMARALFRDWFVDFGPTRRQMEGATDPAAIMGHAFPLEKAATLAPLFPAKIGKDGLPEGWDKQPVGELSEIVGGGTPSTKTEEFWEGGTHLWATPRDLSKLSGVFIGNTERKLTDEGLAKVSSGLSPKGSVLMSSRAPIGYLAIASIPVAVNQGFIVMRPTDQFPTHFAKLWCEANMETIESNANGSTFQEISKKNFKPILATVSSTEVMAAFSKVAGLLFDKLQANEQENQTLADMRDLLLPKLMSGEIRLKDAEALV